MAWLLPEQISLKVVFCIESVHYLISGKLISDTVLYSTLNEFLWRKASSGESGSQFLMDHIGCYTVRVSTCYWLALNLCLPQLVDILLWLGALGVQNNYTIASEYIGPKERLRGCDLQCLFKSYVYIFTHTHVHCRGETQQSSQVHCAKHGHEITMKMFAK